MLKNGTYIFRVLRIVNHTVRVRRLYQMLAHRLLKLGPQYQQSPPNIVNERGWEYRKSLAQGIETLLK